MNMLDLYTDYLLSSFSATPATGLSRLTDQEVSHDKVTRFLSSRDFTSKDLWHLVKKHVRDIERADGVLIFDDTIEKKPYTQENEVVCWHYDHTLNRSEKGINIVNCLYHSHNISLPVSFEVVHKYPVCDLKDQKEKRRANRSKNEMMRDMLAVAVQNHLKFSYVLADSWYAAADNIKYIVKKLDKYFVMPLKSNRMVATSKKKWLKKEFVHIEDLAWKEKPLKVWLKDVAFPILLHKQVFINKDQSSGVLYLATNNLNCTKDMMEKIYQKRWNIETFHRTLKQNASLAKSPTKVIRTQCNHILLAIWATVKLELLSMKEHCNHYQIKWKLYYNALKVAWKELQTIKKDCSWRITA